MKLFMVHCGFYDADVSDGLYESHVNYFVCATDFDHAKKRAKELQEFQKKRMHIDGLQEIKTVDGFDIELTFNSGMDGKTVVINYKNRELAPKKKS